MSEQSGQRRPIRTLPSYIADRIKAGEVVERPAAVVKELMENALDADAHKVTVIITDAGRTLIQVIDDGYGMTPADMLLAIQRYATSKLTRYEDLDTLATYGFRGEALPSIAAVSRLEMVSCLREGSVGSRLKVDGGTIGTPEPAATPPGTSISVSHLFYNVPARRKFLRSDSSEFSHIVAVFRNFALAFPQINFELVKNGESLYSLPATNNPRERIGKLVGDDIAEEMIELDFEGEWMHVTGWITPPALAQKSKNDQYLFLNNRPISNYQTTKAIYNACTPYMLSGGHPIYVIFMQSAPDRFDINVHPAKKEVKFDDDKGAFNAVWNAVRRGMSSVQQTVRAETTVGGVSQQPPVVESRKPAGGEQQPSRHIPEMQVRINPTAPLFFVPREHNAVAGGGLPFPKDSSSVADMAKVVPFDPEPVSELREMTVEQPVLWQMFSTYIVSPLKNGVVFFDQHVAHERILFEQALNAMDESPWNSQSLLFPVEISFSEKEFPVFEEIFPNMRAMGFELRPIQARQWEIIGVPTTIRISDEREIVLEIIAEYRENQTARKDPRHRLAASFACKGAVKAGQKLSYEEMLSLIENLFRTRDPEFCPHGRPIYHILSEREVEKWFLR